MAVRVNKKNLAKTFPYFMILLGNKLFSQSRLTDRVLCNPYTTGTACLTGLNFKNAKSVLFKNAIQEREAKLGTRLQKKNV